MPWIHMTYQVKKLGGTGSLYTYVDTKKEFQEKLERHNVASIKEILVDGKVATVQELNLK